MCLILIGKSASGKDAIRNKLISEHGFKSIITYTTRPMRNGEKDGVTYHYISDEDFTQKINNGFFAEYKTYLAQVGDGQYKKWYYGTSKESLEYADENTVIILTPDGVKDVLKYDLDVKVIWVYANNNTIEKRLENRVKNGTAIAKECERRMSKDYMDFKSADSLADKIVYNNDGYNLDEVVEKVLMYYRE